MPKLSIGKSWCSIWVLCVSKGKWGCYIALISTYNTVQHGAGGNCEFWMCDFFQKVQSSILVVAISFLIIKTPLLCSTDVKLSSVQHHSVHTLISVIQHWSEHVGESKNLVYNIQHKGRCLSSSNTSFLGWGFVWFRIERICHHKFPRGTQKKNPYMGLFY